MQEEQSHTFALNDVNRTWNDNAGFAHVVCSCGVELVATIEGTEMARKMADHIRDPENH